MLTAHFRQVTPLTIEVRFFGGGSYEERSSWVGSCNLHIRGAVAEVSMLRLDGEYILQAVRIMKDYLKSKGLKYYWYEHNGLYHMKNIA